MSSIGVFSHVQKAYRGGTEKPEGGIAVRLWSREVN